MRGCLRQMHFYTFVLMKHVSILVPRGHTSLVNIEGTHQILTEVNTFQGFLGRGPLFDVQLVGIVHEADQPNGLFTVKPPTLISEVKKTDLIIIPALHGDPEKAREENAAFIPWIVEQ